MSRLESMRRRLTAQIDGLNWAAQEIAEQSGDVLELGLGNGRTYDHLRQVLPNRRIWVIDRVLQAHPLCVPPKDDFLMGEAEDMLVKLAQRGAKMALTHCDFGVGVKDLDVAVGAKLSPYIAPLMMPGGLIVSQTPLPGMKQVRGPDSIDPDRYLFFRT